MECDNILKCIMKYHYHNFGGISNNVWLRYKMLVSKFSSIIFST